MTGLFAALFLATTPMSFGYRFINHKDIPFATLLLASTHYSLIALRIDFVSRRLWFKTGVAVLSLAGTELAGLLPLPLTAAAIFWQPFLLVAKHLSTCQSDLVRRIVRLVGRGSAGRVLSGFILFFPQLFLGQINQRGASTRFSEIHKWTKSAGNDRYYAVTLFHRDDAYFYAGAGHRGNALCPRTA